MSDLVSIFLATALILFLSYLELPSLFLSQSPRFYPEQLELELWASLRFALSFKLCCFV